MKQTKHWLLTVAVLLCSLTVNAYDFEVDGIYYGILSSTELTVSVTYRGNYSSEYSDEYNGYVTIPSTVVYDNKTYRVASIGDYAFAGCRNLISVLISDGVKTIEKSAFSDCSNLASVSIGVDVTSIANWAFSGCDSLKSVHIKSVESWCKIDFGGYSANPLGCAENLYLDGELVTDLIIPNTVDAIKNYTFSNCQNLISVNISETVVSIGDWSFYDCHNLISINIPNSVTSIGESAFSICI